MNLPIDFHMLLSSSVDVIITQVFMVLHRNLLPNHLRAYIILFVFHFANKYTDQCVHARVVYRQWLKASRIANIDSRFLNTWKVFLLFCGGVLFLFLPLLASHGEGDHIRTLIPVGYTLSEYTVQWLNFSFFFYSKLITSQLCAEMSSTNFT